MTVPWLTAFLDFPPDVFDAGRSFWREVTGSTLSAPRGPSGQFATLLPSSGDAFLRVQRIDDGVPGVHFDLHVDEVSATARRAVELGASVLDEQPGLAIVASPGGIAGCIVAHGGEQQRRPAPVRWPDGQRSLVDQVCLDIPPSAFSTEGAFWAALTGWERQSGRRPEFEYLVRPPDLPLRILLQRLDQEPPGGLARAHLDFDCDDVPAERRRHEALGATVVRTTTWWTTLRDPAGLEYCVTAHDPTTGTL